MVKPPGNESSAPQAPFHRVIGPLFHLGRGFWVRFLYACLIVILLEAAFDEIVGDEGLPTLTQSIFNVTGLYQRLLTAPRTPVPRYTAVVEINFSKDSPVAGFNEICEQRKAMVAILYGLARALPRVVVLDKVYPPHRPNPCAADSDLSHAVEELRRNNIPVIVGRAVSNHTIRSGWFRRRYYLMPSINFGDAGPCGEPAATRGSLCFEGIANIDPDTRRLPMEWELYDNADRAREGKGAVWRDTLALDAALAYDEKLASHHPKLFHFLSSTRHPYISFLREDEFDPILISEIPTADSVTRPCDVRCNGEPTPAVLRKLSGRIVVIGEVNKDYELHPDTHPTVFGEMSGLYLQANYIEALLDDRYFRAMPAFDYIFGFIFVASLELILIIYSERWQVAGVLIVFLFTITVLVLYFTLMHLGWYVNPAPVGATAILVKLLHAIFGPAERAI